MADRVAQIRSIVAKHGIPVSSNKKVFAIKTMDDVHKFHDHLFAGIDNSGFLAINIPITITVVTKGAVDSYNGIVIIFQQPEKKNDIFIINNGDGVDLLKRGMFRNLNIIERLLDGKPLRAENENRAISIRVAV